MEKLKNIDRGEKETRLKELARKMGLALAATVALMGSEAKAQDTTKDESAEYLKNVKEEIAKLTGAPVSEAEFEQYKKLVEEKLVQRSGDGSFEVAQK